MRITLNAQKLSFGASYHSGGISRYIYYLLRELRTIESGHRFEALAPELAHDPALGATPRFRLTRAGAPLERPLHRIVWEQLVLPLRLAGRADLLHGLAYALPLGWRGRTVVTIFDLSFLRYPELFNRGNRLYLTWASRLAAKRANRILTISEHCRREVIELLGVSPDRVSTTYCAADGRFRPLPRAQVEAFRTRHNLPDRFILYLGTLEPRKNVETLVRAYAHLRAGWADAPRLVLAGARGWLWENIFETISELGLRQYVDLPGFVAAEEQALWYNAASVFAYPSLYEGFGLPPLEAMACGTPVVASNASSLPEVVGEAGITVSPLDEQALADSLRRILEDSSLAARLRDAGLERAAQFSWRRLALETVRCYDEVAAA